MSRFRQQYTRSTYIFYSSRAQAERWLPLGWQSRGEIRRTRSVKLLQVTPTSLSSSLGHGAVCLPFSLNLSPSLYLLSLPHPLSSICLSVSLSHLYEFLSLSIFLSTPPPHTHTHPLCSSGTLQWSPGREDTLYLYLERMR